MFQTPKCRSPRGCKRSHSSGGRLFPCELCREQPQGYIPGHLADCGQRCAGVSWVVGKGYIRKGGAALSTDTSRWDHFSWESPGNIPLWTPAEFLRYSEHSGATWDGVTYRWLKAAMPWSWRLWAPCCAFYSYFTMRRCAYSSLGPRVAVAA